VRIIFDCGLDSRIYGILARLWRWLFLKLPSCALLLYCMCCIEREFFHYSTKGRFALYATFPFRRGKSPFSKIFSCVIKRRCSHWQECLCHISVPFRRHCWARMFDATERVRIFLYLLDSDNVNSLTSLPLHFECLLASSAACFCLQKWMRN